MNRIAYAGTCSVILLCAQAVHAEPKPKPAAVEYMTQSACPFASWFGDQPANTGVWENNLLSDFRKAWEKAGRPAGGQVNDHNYNTLLGKGNTHGFLAGSLTIDNSKLPLQYRVGLFAKSEKHPLVARFSDFGADKLFQIGRLAIKLPWSEAWAGEINWLFTETLDTFPLSNGRDLAVFAKDPEVGLRAQAYSASHGAASIGRSKLIGELSDGYLLGKEYYSQVPYALGDVAAMRFRLVPDAGTRTCFGTLKASRKEMLKGVRETIEKHDAVYTLEIQVHPDQKSDAVTRGASKRWEGFAEHYYAVGKLVLPMQTTDPAGVSVALKEALTVALKPNAAQANALDKLFYFHPISTSKEHRPLGEINEFRAEFYSQHASTRFQTIHAPIAAGHEKFVIPFAALNAHTEVRKLLEK